MIDLTFEDCEFNAPDVTRILMATYSNDTGVNYYINNNNKIFEFKNELKWSEFDGFADWLEEFNEFTGVWSSSVSIKLDSKSIEQNLLISLLIRNPVVVILKDKNERYWLIGDYGLYINKVNSRIGKNDNSDSFSLTGNSSFQCYELEYELGESLETYCYECNCDDFYLEDILGNQRIFAAVSECLVLI